MPEPINRRHFLGTAAASGLALSLGRAPAAEANSQLVVGVMGTGGRGTGLALASVWREHPARSAALAMRTVVGFLGDRGIPRQVRLYRSTHELPLPGHTGLTALPTAAVRWALVRQGARGP